MLESFNVFPHVFSITGNVPLSSSCLGRALFTILPAAFNTSIVRERIEVILGQQNPLHSSQHKPQQNQRNRALGKLLTSHKEHFRLSLGSLDNELTERQLGPGSHSYFHGLFAVVVFLNREDGLLHFSKNKIAMTVVGL